MFLSSPISKVKRPRRKVKPEVKPTGFTMRPLKFLAHEVVTKRHGNPFPTNEVTKAMVDDLKYAFEHNMNSVSIWDGGPGEGKSNGALRLSCIWTEMTKQKKHVCWDIDRFPPLNDGDWVHLDEWLVGEGPGKIQAINRLWNKFSTVRAKGICISVSTPKSPEIPFVTFLATTLAQDWDNELNIYEIRVPLPRHGMVYIGNAIIPLVKNKDPVFWAKYEKDSYDRKTQLIDADGKKIIDVKVDIKKVADIVRKYAVDNDYALTTLGHAKTLLELLKQEHKWDINYDTEDKVANFIIMQGKIRIDSGIVPNLVPDYTGQTVDLRKAICDRMIGVYGVDEIAITIMEQYYLENESQSNIARRFDVSQATISNWVGQGKKKRGKIPLVIGFAFEDVWAAKLRLEGMSIKVARKNTDEPDILILDSSKNIINVHSVKCLLNPKEVLTIRKSQIAAEELKLWSDGIPLTIVVYDYIAGVLHEIPYTGQDNITIRKPKGFV